MFTCQGCGGTFEKARSDEEARAEADQLWGGAEADAVVCEDCWQAMMAREPFTPDDQAAAGLPPLKWLRLVMTADHDPLVQATVEIIRSKRVSAAEGLAEGLLLQSKAHRDLMKRHVDLVANGPQPPMTLVLPNGAEVKAGSVLPGGVRRTRAAAELDATIFGSGAYEEVAPARWCSHCGVAEAEAGPVKDDAHLRSPDDACGPLMTVAQMVQQIGDLSDELGEQIVKVHDLEAGPPCVNCEQLLEDHYTGRICRGVEGHMHYTTPAEEAEAKLMATLRGLGEKWKMVRALATDQFRMHEVNGDGLGCTGRISSILIECDDALRGKT